MFLDKLFGKRLLNPPVKNTETESVPKINRGAIQNQSQHIAADYMEIDSDGVLENYTGQEEVVIVPDGIREIGTWAFESNRFIKEIVLPESLVEIGDGAFEGSSLEKIIVPSHVKKMGDSVFYNCEKLNSIILPDDLTHIESSTFGWCKGLKQITLPSKLKKVGEEAFECSGITELHIPDSMAYIGADSFKHMHCLERLYLPSTLKGIGKEAFSFCENLKEVVLPEGLKKIESSAFYACSKLEKVVFPKSLVAMDRRAFARTKIADSEELQVVYADLDEVRVIPKPDGYEEMTFDGLKFYYQYEEVDYAAHGHQGVSQLKNYGFEHDRNIADSQMIFKNKDGKKALVIYVSVPTFDSGDREWDSYRKLFLIPEEEGMIGFMVYGGYDIAKILTYKDVRYADGKTEKLLNAVVKYLKENGN